MFCKWCISANARALGLRENIFTKGCNNFRKSTDEDHVKIDDHKNAVSLHYQLSLIKSTENTNKPIETFTKSNFKIKTNTEFLNLLSLFRNLYYVCQENLALLKLHGIDFNKNYQNKTSGKEIMSFIADSIRGEILLTLKNLLSLEYRLIVLKT